MTGDTLLDQVALPELVSKTTCSKQLPLLDETFVTCSLPVEHGPVHVGKGGYIEDRRSGGELVEWWVWVDAGPSFMFYASSRSR